MSLKFSQSGWVEIYHIVPFVYFHFFKLRVGHNWRKEIYFFYVLLNNMIYNVIII